MTSDEYREILKEMTRDSRKDLSNRFYQLNDDTVESLVSHFENAPDGEQRIVNHLRRNIPGCNLPSESERTREATIQGAWYAEAAFWSATILGLLGLAATMLKP